MPLPQRTGWLRAMQSGLPGSSGSVVTLLADSGDRYADTYFDADWLSAQGLDTSASAEVLSEFERSGSWS